MLEKLSEFMKRDYNLKTITTEECCGVVKVEVIYFTSNTSFPLLTLAYSKKTGDFVLAIERRYIAQHSTLQALIKALRDMKEVKKGNVRI
ncbi:MAG: hypothetical protein EJNHJLOP_00041 [Methanophagales virus PBV082]|uniref:Uncharacterized protein n=1 Tax=Methanophagales virus PBV082 TaxID=3071307 RepID=A0AA46TE87_9VIRU|nr:MAG: hypothetical protein QIT52_gp41 [Methanophagales virus PBV082]UYL64930.1 MAG: hypothetical protein EJNHJLOP_00041 [Methanophagales virus PBV082]